MITQSSILQSTTQKYLEIFDITNDIIMLQDGSCSLVLKTSAINFDLFSEEEQDATIYAYAALLNSLSFPIEIVVRSQKKDVTGYLDLLKGQEVKAYNPVQKRQIREYRQFIEQLVQERNVLDKKFYIILTASAIELGLASAPSVVPGLPTTKKTAPILDKYAILEKALPTLQPRRDHIAHQCARIGLYTQQLTTQELIQLFYTVYNPEAAKGQKVMDTNDYTTPLVSADLRVGPEVTVPAAPAPTQVEPPAATLSENASLDTSLSLPPTPKATPASVPAPSAPASIAPPSNNPLINGVAPASSPAVPVAATTAPIPAMPKPTPIALSPTPTPVSDLPKPTPPPLNSQNAQSVALEKPATSPASIPVTPNPTTSAPATTPVSTAPVTPISPPTAPNSIPTPSAPTAAIPSAPAIPTPSISESPVMAAPKPAASVPTPAASLKEETFVINTDLKPPTPPPTVAQPSTPSSPTT